tara:strand:- start:14719 stop:15402 length:684 start_codon:yes stop_codon:yes gene_type:complete
MVNVDTVYQKVLIIANKEQRGYITPLEFNLLASQAQMEIFNNYFVEMSQLKNIPGNESEYSDAIKTLNEKISIFKKIDNNLFYSNLFFRYPDDLYKLGTVYFVALQNGNIHTDGVEVQEITDDELLDYHSSPLTTPTVKRPIYIRREKDIRVYPDAITFGIKCSYIRKPVKPEWGYVVVNEQALYNANSAQNFELHASEETNLVLKILGLAGIIMQKQDIAAIGQQA